MGGRCPTLPIACRNLFPNTTALQPASDLPLDSQGIGPSLQLDKCCEMAESAVAPTRVFSHTALLQC